MAVSDRYGGPQIGERGHLPPVPIPHPENVIKAREDQSTAIGQAGSTREEGRIEEGQKGGKRRECGKECGKNVRGKGNRR